MSFQKQFTLWHYCCRFTT